MFASLCLGILWLHVDTYYFCASVTTWIYCIKVSS